jgi:hypothetical protein
MTAAWLDCSGRFPAPRWELLGDSKREQVDAVDAWSEALRLSLGELYEIIDTERFVVVSGVKSEQGDLLAGALERALTRVLTRLAGAAKHREFPRHLAIVFHDQRLFLEYVAGFYPDFGEFGIPGAVYVPAGLGQSLIAPGPTEGVEASITHETTHMALQHLDLPRWLDEGLAVNMEIAYHFRRSMRFDREHVEEHRSYWTPERVARFWAGETFYDQDEGQPLSYALAEFLLGALPGEESEIMDFIRAAKADDAGFAAASEILGVDLDELAAPLTCSDTP